MRFRPNTSPACDKEKGGSEKKKTIENDRTTKNSRNEPTWTGLNLRINFRGPGEIHERGRGSERGLGRHRGKGKKIK